MRFERLKLRDFRNYGSLELEVPGGITVLYGANGCGKTNLLEALHLLSVGRSHRTPTDREMIAQGAEAASSAARLIRADGSHRPEVRLIRTEKPHKRVLLNGKPAAHVGDLMGHATVVMFAPEDLRIVRDNPAARRRFLDMQLSQIRPLYLKQLRTYLSVLESRNALLREQKLIGVPQFERQMDVWDDQLCRAAVPLVESRAWFVSFLKQTAAEQYAAICEDAGETFSMRYQCAVQKPENTVESLREALERSRGEDVQRAFTYHGPHRDDVAFTLAGRDLRAYGSQGQVRTAVLSMKLGEIRLIEQDMGEPPALLLDDVFSELDPRRRSALLRSAQGIQTLISCTDREDAAEARADCFWHVTRDGNGMGTVRTEE